MSTEWTTGPRAARSGEAPGAFGLAIDSDAGIPGLATPGAVAGSRSVRHRVVDAEVIAERCAEGTLTLSGAAGEGALRREYHRHSSSAQLIRSESYGQHLIADGGRTVLSAVDGASAELWQRYVLGQVLPMAASLQGLEVFHASAVATEAGVIALAGRSGAGKSSLATALLCEGATFFVDDVLAIELTASGVTAFPGPTLMGVPLAELDRIGDHADGPAWVTDERKAIVPVRGEREALPILAFIALSAEEEEATSPRFAPCPPNRLMGLTFDGLSRTPERLRRLLRVSALLAAEDRALELRFSPRSHSAALAGAILERLPAAAAAGSR